MSDKTKVLLIDDDPGFLKATSLLLEDAGYQVATATDGPSGLAAAMRDRPDVAIIDIMMRRPDEGFALARALRAEPSLAGVGLLVLTAAGERYQMQFEPDDLWLPGHKVLEKPIAPGRLAAEIDGLLARLAVSEDRT
jgi:CheY-like chemotaxis protein